MGWDPMPELTNLILCPLQSRLQLIHHERTTLCQSRLYPLVSDFGFCLSFKNWHTVFGSIYFVNYLKLVSATED
jgi:hypothetical protein